MKTSLFLWRLDLNFSNYLIGEFISSLKFFSFIGKDLICERKKTIYLVFLRFLYLSVYLQFLRTLNYLAQRLVSSVWEKKIQNSLDSFIKNLKKYQVEVFHFTTFVIIYISVTFFFVIIFY